METAELRFSASLVGQRGSQYASEWSVVPVLATDVATIQNVGGLVPLLPQDAWKEYYKKHIDGYELWFHAKKQGLNSDIAAWTIKEPTTKAQLLAGFFPEDTNNSQQINVNTTSFSWYSINVPYNENNEDVVAYGCGLRGTTYSNPVDVHGVGSGYDPYIILHFEDVVFDISSMQPQGLVSRSDVVRFSWLTNPKPETSGNTLLTVEPVTIKNAVFRWKTGRDGNPVNISVGTNHSYSMPANTLPERADIYWQIEVTSDDGVVSTSEWVNITTTDYLPTVTPVRPNGEYIGVDGDVEFSWIYSIPSGSAQSSYEIQVKPMFGEWVPVASGQSSASSVLVPVENIPSGNVVWRVRAANAKGDYSEWSDSLAFVAVSPPLAPAINLVSNSAKPVIAWQSGEQQGYEAQIGGFSTGVVYGSVKQMKSADFMEDGPVTARVRIVNEFGLWSKWSELTFNVVGSTLSGTVSLNVTAGVDAHLSWNLLSNATGYQVFRNGKKIADISGSEYVDRLCLGRATYYVKAYSGDSYIDSNKTEVELHTDHPMVSPFDGEWIDLKLSATSTREIKIRASREVKLVQYSGFDYQHPEASRFREKTYSIDTSFTDAAESARFEALLDGLVIVKDQYGTCMVGVMSAFSKVQNEFLASYSVTVSEVDGSVYENV